MNFLERLSRAFSELDALQEEVRQSREKITDDREVFPIAREQRIAKYVEKYQK